MLGPSSSGQEQGWLPGTMGKRVLGMGMGAVPLGGLGRVHVEILCQHCWMGWVAPAPPRHVPAVAGHGLGHGVKASPLGTATDAASPSRAELGCLWEKNC